MVVRFPSFPSLANFFSCLIDFFLLEKNSQEKKPEVENDLDNLLGSTDKGGIYLWLKKQATVQATVRIPPPAPKIKSAESVSAQPAPASVETPIRSPESSSSSGIQEDQQDGGSWKEQKSVCPNTSNSAYSILSPSRRVIFTLEKVYSR